MQEMCENCKGIGEVDKVTTVYVDTDEGNRPFFKTKMCMVCQGSGTLDWIEKIKGKKQDENDPLYPWIEGLTHHSTEIISFYKEIPSIPEDKLFILRTL